MKTIDINCDMGESYGPYKVGNDQALMPYITSCNIACGMHGGDPDTIRKTIDSAISHNVTIGAHPSYPDLAGFGRRQMDIPYAELKSLIKYQILTIRDIAQSKGADLKYVKPHGALYNTAANNEKEGRAVIDAILEIDNKLCLLGLSGSPLNKLTDLAGLVFISEAFADRRYTSQGTLVSRKIENAVIHDPIVAARQTIDLINNGQVVSLDGDTIEITARSICIHGDNPQAEQILKAIDLKLSIGNVAKKSFA